VADLFPIIVVALLVAHVGLVVWLLRTKRLEKWDLSLLLGVVIMQRTQRGKRLIDAIARPRLFWNLVGDLGMTLGGMVAMTFLFLWTAVRALEPGSGLPTLGLQEILVIPGVNPFVPLWYGLFALAITLIVHEGGHGVLARANGMKLKSLGLLWLVVPVGAFVEPEDLDLKVAKRWARLRVFGAGPAVNIGMAALALLGFALLVGMLAPKPGLWVAGVTQDEDGNDLPAKRAGLVGGDIIVSIDGEAVDGPAGFDGILDGKSPGQVVWITTEAGRTVGVTLERAWDAFSAKTQDEIHAWTPRGQAICQRQLEPDPASARECSERLVERPFLGVHHVAPSQLAFLAHPFSNLYAFGFLIQLPLSEVLAQSPVLSVYLPSFYDEPFHAATFWVVVNLLFWIFWINLMVGVTNILPMLPLDGGHIFREALGGTLQRLAPRMATERRDKVVGGVAAAMSFVILGALILQLIGPRLVG
jgi:membrane-associated protease RseP (regulator of RpoE activity)